MGDTIHTAFITSAAYKPKAFSSVHRHKVFKEGLSMEGLIYVRKITTGEPKRL